MCQTPPIMVAPRRTALFATALAVLSSCSSSNLDISGPQETAPPTAGVVDGGVPLDQVFAPGTEVELPFNWPELLPPPQGSQLWQVNDISVTTDPRTASFFLLPGRSVDSALDQYRDEIEGAGLAISEEMTENGPDWTVASRPPATIRLRETQAGASVVVILRLRN